MPARSESTMTLPESPVVTRTLTGAPPPSYTAMMPPPGPVVRKPPDKEEIRPLGAFRFIIEMENSGVVVGAFTQFSGVKVTVQTIDARSGSDIRGVQNGIPTLTQFGPVTLTKGVVGDNDFLDWLFSVAANMESGPSAADERTLNVIALDDMGRRSVTWTLKDAFPIGYELTPMDGSRSEVLSESLTFAIAGVKRKVEN